jgi:hypothetical protein
MRSLKIQALQKQSLIKLHGTAIVSWAVGPLL